MWGCSFKADTDDIRDSPALQVASTLQSHGARVTIYDPAAMERARQIHPELNYADSMREAVVGADVLLLLTAWPEFSEADPDELAEVVAQRNVADGRNLLVPDRWREAGWHYRALGRRADGISSPGTWFPDQG